MKPHPHGCIVNSPALILGEKRNFVNWFSSNASPQRRRSIRIDDNFHWYEIDIT